MTVDLTRFIDEPKEPTNDNPLFADLGSQTEKVSPVQTYTVAPEPSLTSVTEPYTPSKLGYNYSLTDLEKDPEFAKRAERYLQAIGRNENIFEYLRDENFSLSSAFIRSTEVGDWTEQEKQDYIYLRDKFNNANLKGFKERFNLVKDLSVDVFTDPLNILAGLFAIPTGGASLATRGALGTAAQAGVKKLTASQLSKRAALKQAKAVRAAKQTALFGAAEGMAWAGPHEFFLQDIDVDLGIRDEYDLGSIAGMAVTGGLVGGIAGGAIGGGLGLYGNRYLTKEFKHTNENLIDNVASSQTRKEIVEDSKIDLGLASGRDTLNKGIANTFGKPTTWFNSYVEKSPTLKEFLKKLRYDYDTTLTSRGEKGVKEKSFGLFMGETIGKYQYALSKSLNVLYRTGWRARLDKNQEASLLKLLRDNTLDINNVDKLKGQVEPAVIQAYKGVRETLDTAFKDAAQVGLFGPLVRFSKGYFPRLFKYEILEKKQDKFKELLIKSGHADPINDIPTVKFVDELTDEVRKGVLRDAKGVDDDIFGTNFLKEAGVKGTKVGKTQQIIYRLEDATPEQLLKAKELKADMIVKDMLEYRWTPFELRQKGQRANATGFLQERRFRNIKDEDMAEFLEDDLQQILETYFTNTGQAIARARYFGKTLKEFEDNTIKPMRKELEAAGMKDLEIKKILERARYTHGRVTGIETDAGSVLKKQGWARSMADWGKLSQQMAHLPFATLSSVTEPLLLLSRAGLKDSPAVIKDIASSIVKEGNSVLDRSINGIQRGVFGK